MFYKGLIINYAKENACSLCISVCITLVIDYLFLFSRIQKWRSNTNLDKAELDLTNPDICTSCGHQGKAQKHARSGCTDCGTVKKCNDGFR